MVRLPSPHSLTSTLVGVAALVAAGASAAQAGPAARPTGIFLRAGGTVSGFDLASMTFRLQERPRSRDAAPSFTGKQAALGREWLGGGTLSAHVDGPWFYVRVGADVYANPSRLEAGFQVESTALGWIAAGPRFIFGRFTLLAGVRVGALLVGLTHTDANSDGVLQRRDYTGLSPLYAVDVGAQWRPARWLQVDATLGQDVLGVMLATTASLNVNIGWSAAPR